jgi:dihydroorotate dehydrogenase electron transfer subunit
MVHQYQKRAEVIRSEQLSEDIFRLTLLAPEISEVARPGQFVMLRISEAGHDPLLRRPFSIYQVTGNGRLQILYKVVGKVTRLMTLLRPGKQVELLGPLGHGFALKDTKNLCLVGGGVGAAPLFFLSTWLARHSATEMIVLLGARTSLELQPLAAGFEDLGIRVIKATDDGSEGYHGYVVDIIDKTLQDHSHPWRIYSCGPYPMLRAVSKLSQLRNWSCQVSLETMMACGISACLGCAVPRAGLDGYLHACKDGPVFNATQLAWL